MVRRRVVFPKEALLASKLANMDLTQWLKDMVRKHEAEGVKVKVHGPYEECYIGGESIYPVFELELQDSATGEKVLDKLELEIDSRIYEAVINLTDKEKVVLIKRVEEGKSLAQIAFEMGIKPQSVVSFIDSIKGKIKKALAS